MQETSEDLVTGEYEFTYKNWKGVTARRRVQTLMLYFGHTEHHTDDQWLLTAVDTDKEELRTFAVKDIQGWHNEGPIRALCETVLDREKLRTAVKKHRDQRGDNRCHLDDQELYAALGDGVPTDLALPAREEFLKSCARFWEQRQPDADKTCPKRQQKTIQQLEDENRQLKSLLAGLVEACCPEQET